MNFGFTEEQELLRTTARDFLAEHASSQRVREIMEGPERMDSELWGRLAELGWMGLAIPEEHGGAGLSITELCIVLEELGRALAPVPFLPTLIAAAAIRELGDAAQQAAWLPRIASGELRATLALTEERADRTLASVALSARRAGRGWELTGSKCFVPDAGVADLLVTIARIEGEGEDECDPGLGVFLVPHDGAGVAVREMRSMDLLRPLCRVDFQDTPVEGALCLGGDTDAGEKLERVLGEAQVMISAEMVGGAEACLEASVEYAKERVQFGKPIGVNQAIKHRCADMLFAVESARSITYYAAWAAHERNDDAALTASMAKSYASDAYRQVSGDNIQVHGGVGFTWEYDCHLYFKRSRSDDVWLGDGTWHRERVAQLLPV